jgi:hypothetical protein
MFAFMSKLGRESLGSRLLGMFSLLLGFAKGLKLAQIG